MLMVLNFTHFKKWIIISAFVNLSWQRQILEKTSDMSTADQRLQCNTFYECIPQPRFPSWLSMGWLFRVWNFRGINSHFSSQILQLYIIGREKKKKAWHQVSIETGKNQSFHQIWNLYQTVETQTQKNELFTWRKDKYKHCQRHNGPEG